MKFLGWLLEQSERNDPVGDLAQDSIIVKDGRKPRYYATKEDWHKFLKEYHACEEAHQALDQAWAEYKRFLANESAAQHGVLRN